MSNTVRGLAVPDTEYWILVNGQRSASRVTIVDRLRQPARDLTLVDGWPPDHLRYRGATTDWIAVLERIGRGPVTVPADLARVSPVTARAAVAEFVATGRRPTCVTWME